MSEILSCRRAKDLVQKHKIEWIYSPFDSCSFLLGDKVHCSVFHRRCTAWPLKGIQRQPYLERPRAAGG